MRIRVATSEDAAGMARVNVESWRTTYRGIVAQATLDRMSVEVQEPRQRRNLSQPDWCAFVVETEEKEIVGYAVGGPERTGETVYTGELYALYLLLPYQRQGWGRRLVGQVAEWLAQRGMHSMLIWVLRDNPARKFYEALGGRYLREQPLTIGGETLTEVAYSWSDIEPLRSIAANERE